MAREIVTRIWCDVCLKKGDHVEAEETPPVVVGTFKARTVALCEKDRKEFYDPFRDVLVELGQVIPSGAIDAPTPRKGIGGRPTLEDLTCKAPECGHQAPNKAALASHVRNMHDTTIAELEGLPLNYECPECQRKFERPQGLAAHRRTTHGVPGQNAHANTAKAKGGKKSTRDVA